jgi:hypothetical protein
MQTAAPNTTDCVLKRIMIETQPKLNTWSASPSITSPPKINMTTTLAIQPVRLATIHHAAFDVSRRKSSH